MATPVLEKIQQPIIEKLQRAFPTLMAVYGFGSQIANTANIESDLDLAVLIEGQADAQTLWVLASELADIAHCSVDLVDLRRASTVMQYQIITTGQLWWKKDSRASIYEAFILSEKTALDTARVGILKDIQQTGIVYGR